VADREIRLDIVACSIVATMPTPTATKSIKKQIETTACSPGTLQHRSKFIAASRDFPARTRLSSQVVLQVKLAF